MRAPAPLTVLGMRELAVEALGADAALLLDRWLQAALCGYGLAVPRPVEILGGGAEEFGALLVHQAAVAGLSIERCTRAWLNPRQPLPEAVALPAVTVLAPGYDQFDDARLDVLAQRTAVLAVSFSIALLWQGEVLLHSDLPPSRVEDLALHVAARV